MVVSTKVSRPCVQFVSKPMTAPFRDGSKCLVRDLCRHLVDVEPHVMGIGEPAEGLEGAVSHRVYAAGGEFRPGLRQNLQAASFLLFRSRADLWHFVFAPNPRSSQVAQVLKTIRRRKTIQTIASPPLSFDDPHKLLFGDAVVAQSAWTKREFEKSFEAVGKRPPPLFEIPPPAPELECPSKERQRDVRAAIGVEVKAPLFLYPGDLEVSRGAQNVVRWSQAISNVATGARVVVAYRDKTPSAKKIAEELEAKAPSCVCFAREVPDIHALVAASRAVLFPVDDLYGKVDLPIVLLEAFRIGTPVFALKKGPLESLLGGLLLEEDGRSWVDALQSLSQDEGFFQSRVEAGHDAVRTHYAPERIASKYAEVYRTLLE